VGKQGKTLQKIVSGTQNRSIDFTDLISLLSHLGFAERIHGDHHIFTKDGITEIINIQPDGSNAKAYQVRQIGAIITKYHLEVQE
jgi:hypothetical protein